MLRAHHQRGPRVVVCAQFHGLSQPTHPNLNLDGFKVFIMAVGLSPARFP